MSHDIDRKLQKQASMSFKKYLKKLEEEVSYDGVDNGNGMLPPARTKNLHVSKFPIDKAKVAYSKAEDLFRLPFKTENLGMLYIYFGKEAWYDIRTLQQNVSFRFLDAKGKEWRFWHDTDGNLYIIDDVIDIEAFISFTEFKAIVTKIWPDTK